MMCPGRAVRITLEVTNNYNKAMQLGEFTSANLRFVNVNPAVPAAVAMSIQAITKPNIQRLSCQIDSRQIRERPGGPGSYSMDNRRGVQEPRQADLRIGVE